MSALRSLSQLEPTKWKIFKCSLLISNDSQHVRVLHMRCCRAFECPPTKTNSLHTNGPGSRQQPQHINPPSNQPPCTEGNRLHAIHTKKPHLLQIHPRTWPSCEKSHTGTRILHQAQSNAASCTHSHAVTSDSSRPHATEVHIHTSQLAQTTC